MPKIISVPHNDVAPMKKVQLSILIVAFTLIMIFPISSVGTASTYDVKEINTQEKINEHKSETIKNISNVSIDLTATNLSISTKENNNVTSRFNINSSYDGEVEYSIINQPAHGTVEIQNGSEFTYSPNTEFVGTDSFRYEVNNRSGSGDTATVSIDVEKDGISLSIAPSSVNLEDQETVDIIAEDISDGMGGYEISIESANTSVVSIEDYRSEIPTQIGPSTDIASDNSSISIDAVVNSQDLAENKTIGSVIIKQNISSVKSDVKVPLNLSVERITDFTHSKYSIQSVRSGVVNVPQTQAIEEYAVYTGTVVDGNSGEAISNAEIAVVNSTGQVISNVTTKSNGSYSLNIHDELSVRVSAEGYKIKSTELSPHIGTNIRNFSLMPRHYSPEPSVANFTVSTQTVSVGEPVEFEATVENPGPEENLVEVILYDDGRAIKETNATIGGYSEIIVNWSTSFKTSDRHTLSVNNKYITNITVEPQAPTLVNDSPAQDPDGDGLYQDVNGDGTVDIADVQTLFSHQESASTEFFDINNDGRITIGDVQALYASI